MATTPSFVELFLMFLSNEGILLIRKGREKYGFMLHVIILLLNFRVFASHDKINLSQNNISITTKWTNDDHDNNNDDNEDEVFVKCATAQV